MSSLSIPVNLLHQSRKILFISHLALGDFTYLQNCLLTLARAYPNLAIHIWVDELRRTSDAAKWPYLKKYILYDWLRECSFISKIYDETYTPLLFQQSLRHAQTEEYPIIVSLSLLNRAMYARMARKISPHGFIVGQTKSVHFPDIRSYLAYRNLNVMIPNYVKKNQQHISAIYAKWFEELFSIHIPENARFPFVDIPEKWQDYAQQQMLQWGLNDDQKIIFLNGFSKANERSWPLQRIIELAIEIKKKGLWTPAEFILNVIPEKLEEAQKLIQNNHLDWIHLFSAEENFFQLPAILARCHLIISVETALIHLANAVQVPVVALMRQTNPEWIPLDSKNSFTITVPTAKGMVEDIHIKDVMTVLTSWERIHDLSKTR